MLSKMTRFKKTLVLAALLAGVLAVTPVASAWMTCTGPMYIYYQTKAKLIETGAKVVCPTGNIYDTGPMCQYQETPYFVVVPGMSCPCSGPITNECGLP